MSFDNWSVLLSLFAFGAGAVALSISLYLVPNWRHATARLLLLHTLSASIWCLGYGMEFLSPYIEVKVWWTKAKFVGASWVGYFFLGFILIMTGKKAFVKGRLWYLLGMVPVLIIVLILTNDIHNIMWADAWIDTSGLAPVLVYVRNIGYWGLLVGFNYLCVFIGTGFALFSIISAKGKHKKLLNLIVLGTLIALLANIIYQLGFEVLKNFDFTPVSIAFSGLIYAYGILKYQMPGLLPLAHETIADSMTDPVLVVDMQDRLLFLNKTALAECGVDDPVASNLYLGDVFPDLFRQVLNHREKYNGYGLHPVIVKTLSRQWYLKHFPLLDKRGKTIGQVISLRDITDKKNIERALKERKRVDKIILEASPNPVIFCSGAGMVTYLNPSFTKVFGWTLSDLVEDKLDFIPERTTYMDQMMFDSGDENFTETYEFISKRQTKAGEILDVFVGMTIYSAEDNDSTSMVVNFTDITGIKKAERELRKTKDFIQNIIDSMPSCLIGLDSEGIISHWNLGAEEMTRLSADRAEGCSLSEVFPQLVEELPGIYDLVKDQRVFKAGKIELAVMDKQIIADVTLYPILPRSSQRAVIRIDDISEMVRIEKMMVQSEKMLSIGGLAAGMAHEINNPLAGILQNAQVIWNRLKPDLPINIKAAEECGIDLEKLNLYVKKRKIDELMEHVKSSGNRAAHIVSNMLSFARKSERTKLKHYLNELMEDTIELAKNDYNIKREYDFNNIKIIKEYQDDVQPVKCEKNEIQQVFLNIIKNGTEAMAESGTDSPCFIFRYYTQDNYSVFEIQDNGTGIDEKTCKRIFEPFYTTKDIGKGAGLGLSVAYFLICEHHKGALTVNSEPGKGSVFVIKLPF